MRIAEIAAKPTEVLDHIKPLDVTGQRKRAKKIQKAQDTVTKKQATVMTAVNKLRAI